MRIITVETLKTFLDELNKKYGTEFYSKTESDNRYQPKGESSGGSVDYRELARRIPSWRWKVTLPKTEHQTVTATVNGKTYTDNFYAPQGSQVTFSVKANTGYIAGTVSPTSATLDKDLTVTVTAAKTEGTNVIAGSKYFTDGKVEFAVPQNVQVLQWTWSRKDIYTKVNPNNKISIGVKDGIGMVGPEQSVLLVSINNVHYEHIFNGTSFTPLVISWSNEINNHAVDYDWTK